MRDSGVEFKTDSIDNRALAKELVALANLDGGHVLARRGGRRERSRLVQERRCRRQAEGGEETARHTYRRLEEWVMQACRDKIRPEIVPYFQDPAGRGAPGRDVAVVSDQPRLERPPRVAQPGHRTYYLRVGSLSREASPEELARLFQQRGVVRPAAPTGVRHVDCGPGPPPPQRTISSASAEQEDASGSPIRRLAQADRGMGQRTRMNNAGAFLFEDREREWRCSPGDRVGEAPRQYGIPARGGPASGHRRRTAAVRRQSQPVSSTGEDRCGGLLRTGKGLRRQGTDDVARADRPPHRRRRRPAGARAS